MNLKETPDNHVHISFPEMQMIYNHRITESLKSEKTKIIHSNYSPTTNVDH